VTALTESRALDKVLTPISGDSALETPFTESCDGFERCSNPLCGEILEPKRKHAPIKLYCGDTRRQNAWVIRKAAELLRDIAEGEMLKVLRVSTITSS
jgi:hypothetical protein